MARQRGVAVLEALLALTLGLMLLAAAGQVLVSAQQAWRVQGALARMQEDAMLVLQRLAQDIRMTGSFGCLSVDSIEFVDVSAMPHVALPLQITRSADGSLASLELLTAELPGSVGPPDWTLLTDCLTWAQVHERRREGDAATLAIALRRQVYRLQGSSLMLSSGGLNAALIDNVRDFRITRVDGSQGERLDLHLTLADPRHQVEREFALSVALRNRLPAS